MEPEGLALQERRRLILHQVYMESNIYKRKEKGI